MGSLIVITVDIGQRENPLLILEASSQHPENPKR